VVERKTKLCSGCKEPWPLTTEYWHRNRSSPDGFQGLCKPCMIASVRRYQETNRPRYLTAQREYASTLRGEMMAYKESHPCADCGLFYPYFVMSFDHLPGEDKVSDVNKMVKGNGHLENRKRIMAEVEKCALVCMNCHACRTHERWLLAQARAGTPGVRVFRRAGTMTIQKPNIA
jgi:hypothetical protein